MTIFNVISFLGGLALFLFGMNTMSESLEKTAGGKLERVLEKMTDKPINSLFLGIGITALLQSSSAVTVMLVGLVNSGIISLTRSVGIIMGSNIGTTVTAWFLSLTSIETDNMFLNLLKPSNFAPVGAFIGIFFIKFSKKNRLRVIGNIYLGFAILIIGMEMMSDSLSHLPEIPEFRNILIKFDNPILCVITGIFITALVQSSSASVGILQALSATGVLYYKTAIPIIMGQNIGTCVTALISSIGVSQNAKRVAVIHTYFNLFGTAIFLTLFYLCLLFFDLPFINKTVSSPAIAAIHSIFNITTTLLLFPFTEKIKNLAVKTVKNKETGTV